MELNDKEWSEIINSGEAAVIDFSAEAWCGPCRAISPIMDKLTEKYSGILKVGKINVDDNTELTSKYNVMSLPTILFFKDGEIVDKQVGVSTEAGIEAKIANLLN